jgi:hypothetical protein
MEKQSSFKKLSSQQMSKGLPNSPSELNNFDEQHKIWCREICAFLMKNDVCDITYGRAAKLINVYLKAMLVIPNPESEVSYIIHPPIDEKLLKNTAKDKSLVMPTESKRKLRNCAWTKIDENEYFEIITILRNTIKNKPFWFIEKNWY